MSAAEILGANAPATEGEVAVVEAPAVPPEKATAPPAGFENPPPAEEAPPAESLLTGKEAKSTEKELEEIEFEAGAELARQGQPLPDDASNNAKVGYASVAPVLHTPPKEKPAASDPVTTDKPSLVVKSKSFTFLKNIHPGEKMFFEDGKEFVLPPGAHTFTDMAMVKKILEIADRYHIVQQ